MLFIDTFSVCLLIHGWYIPISTAIHCMSLGQIENGLTLYSPDRTEPYDYGTVASHHCNDGFYAVGETKQYCRNNFTGVFGDWNGSYPACTREYFIIAYFECKYVYT